ncbi:acyl-phosphate glycerol 3-phosphate acyltransferase [Kyrpidia spormannii]|uniref:Glycerol-3-phosphate acyltransferase n=1 Tax=Kyrpidia spormannii TaxID=2055160 RepID=A0A2K8N685_9BACL|nr:MULTISPECIES: glycerol-3-phosphate 1-O-acyltransferase PlsY [Kyrpidia]ATY84813.1 acyl-phosphate glycerol 3-phosphate acyltransferase [Kyrpidia spormannii]MCL6574526.1 glycerol-3-phosphate 1-O-acyltransferase PlsY [Kyrpidia sp.]
MIGQGILAAVIGYLLGSISSSVLVGRWMAGIDIRQHGSGNAGATNTLRVLGQRAAAAVLVADVAKGLIAIAVAMALAPDRTGVWAVAGLFAIVGHNWPIFFGFRGGRGIATAIGVLLTLVPVPALVAGGIALIALALTRYVSLGSLLFTLLTAVFAVVFHYPAVEIWLTIAIAALAVWRHRDNIGRLIRGEEHRLGQGKSRL